MVNLYPDIIKLEEVYHYHFILDDIIFMYETGNYLRRWTIVELGSRINNLLYSELKSANWCM
jgi:hypothetical protein